MEPHKQLDDTKEAFRPNIKEGPQAFFEKALGFTQTLYKRELDDIWARDFAVLGPRTFFLEYIWVVHATGFNAKVVAKMMPRLINAYGSYEQLAAVDFESAWTTVQPICNNRPKAQAVHATAVRMKAAIQTMGWRTWKEKALSTPELLQKLSFIGPITCFHLARNMGLLEYVKPDLHLVRLAEYWKYGADDISVIKMCTGMRDGHAQKNKEWIPLGIVDLCLWYLASTFGTLEARGDGKR